MKFNTKGTLVVELLPDGSIKTTAVGLRGTEEAILGDLNELAKTVGGTLVVEKHEHRYGEHTHDHSKTHQHH